MFGGGYPVARDLRINMIDIEEGCEDQGKKRVFFFPEYAYQNWGAPYTPVRLIWREIR